MIDSTIFSRIITHEVAAEILYQDEFVTAFRDKFPQAPIHILIIPNIIIPTVNDVEIDHEPILGKLFIVAAKIAKQHDIADSGYRLIVNCNHNAGQEIFHLHMHLLGGKYLGALLSNIV